MKRVVTLINQLASVSGSTAALQAQAESANQDVKKYSKENELLKQVGFTLVRQRLTEKVLTVVRPATTKYTLDQGCLHWCGVSVPHLFWRGRWGGVHWGHWSAFPRWHVNLFQCTFVHKYTLSILHRLHVADKVLEVHVIWFHFRLWWKGRGEMLPHKAWSYWEKRWIDWKKNWGPQKTVSIHMHTVKFMFIFKSNRDL